MGNYLFSQLSYSIPYWIDPINYLTSGLIFWAYFLKTIWLLLSIFYTAYQFCSENFILFLHGWKVVIFIVYTLDLELGSIKPLAFYNNINKNYNFLFFYNYFFSYKSNIQSNRLTYSSLIY